MSFALILSIGIAVAIGWLSVRLLLPVHGLRPLWAAWLLEASLGIGFGVALTSSTFFLLLLVGAARPAVVIAFEIVLLLVVGFVFLRTQRHRAQPAPSPAVPLPTFRWDWLLSLALCFGVILVIVSFFDSAGARSFGDWDAWSIWNVRAKFLAADDDTWRNGYSPLLHRTHPDYPLLLSGFVARCWKYSGETPPEVPIAVAFLFVCAVTALLVAAVALLRTRSAGLLAGLVLLASSSFLAQGPSQYADVPLSFFILGAFTLLLLEAAARPRRKAILAVAGAFAAFAAWTKNEGMLFFGILIVVLLLVERFSAGWRSASEKCVAFALGALPALLLTVYFKLFLAPPVDPLVSQSVPEALERLVEAGRYVTIAKGFVSEATLLGNGWTNPLVLLAILAVALRFQVAPQQRRWVVLAGVTMGLQLAAYFAGYLVTPAGLDWHLGTSLGRLYAHVWPSVLLLSFTVLRQVEETGAYEETQSRRQKSKGKKKKRMRSA
jgi:cbb3-type cytochrome oxidase subunit 3